MSPDLPEDVKDLAERIKEDNPDLSESEAIAIARDQLNLAADDDCPDGHARVGPDCIPIPEGIDSVDAPPSILSTPQHLTLKNLETEPIERVEEGDNRVRYRNLKLIAPGIWGDAGSEAYAYYPPEGIKNLEAWYDESQYDGPPLNIMHDLDMEEFEAHEPSVAGYIDPETIDHDDEGAKFADIVLDTSTGAGQYADENLQSTLENQGRVGFGGPSVEIPAEGLEQSYDHDRGMHRVDGGRLTGAALVQDPASKSVSFAREAARRPVAMSASSKDAKVLTRKDAGMSAENREAIRDEIMNRTLQIDEIQDDAQAIADELGVPIDEVMELLDPLLDVGEEEEDEGAEMEDDEDEEDEEEEDDTEMEEDEDEEEDEMDDMDALREDVANLSSRLEDVEDALSQAMTAEDVDQELEDAAGNKLADAESVKTLREAKEELETRIDELENRPAESKTLTDAQDSGIDWSDADDGISYDPATGSMSR